MTDENIQENTEVPINIKDSNTEATETSQCSEETKTTEEEASKEETQPAEKPEPKVKTAEDKVADLTDTLQRLQAEFDNYRRRVNEEKSYLINNASKNFIMKLLPIMDNADLAIHNIDNQDEYIKGTVMIFEQIKELLRGEGVCEIKAEGEKFDPNKHEALMTAEVEDADDVDKVIEQLSAGYTMNDCVLRHAKVKVGKPKKD